MGFRWDPTKDESNREKHGIGFSQAAEIFRGFLLVKNDDRRDYGKARWTALGLYDGVRIESRVHPARRRYSHDFGVEGESA